MLARSFVAASVMLFLGVLITSDAAAQQRRNQQQQNLPSTNVSGKVVGMRGNTLQVVSEDNTPYLVQLVPQSSVKVNGEAKADVLAKGLFISFTVKANQESGEIEEDVKELEIFTPSESVPLVFQEEGEKVYFAGRLESINKVGKFTMAVPEQGKSRPKKFRGTIDPEAVVKLVGAPLLLFAQEGDEIYVTGKLAKRPMGNAPGAVYAESVEVKLANVATTEKPKRGE